MNSPYYADDRHKAIIGLRILSIITTLPVFPAVAWTMHAHADVVNDGVGWGFNPGVLAAVRSYTSSLSLWQQPTNLLPLIERLYIHLVHDRPNSPPRIEQTHPPRGLCRLRLPLLCRPNRRDDPNDYLHRAFLWLGLLVSERY